MHHIKEMNPDSLSIGEALALSAELATVTRQQYDALMKSSYLQMPVQDAAEYDERRIRIAEICEALKSYRKKSDSP